ncbi:hypothetical protein RvY_05447 [Ramazzottius varieornatus]|uniref:Uncharacterized protein n=1 Tax=Ramazzottius varieornatus TaxID=947166 RepID=A0A1D1V1Q7_RAMVA|nr:hypothetical protein RvY_05447 [Ramazzottius varieornatus]
MDEDSELKRRVEQKLNDCDVSGAVRILASDDVMAPVTTETLEALRAKHRLEQDSVAFPLKEFLVPPAVPVTSEEVINAVVSFPNGSAGGPDGLRPQHLKDMLKAVRDPASTELAESLALLITLMGNLTLLGAPLFNEAIPSVLKAKTDSAELMTARLEKISSHQALFLLKNCLGIPKLLYVLRCSPTYRWTQLLHDFDDVIRRCTAKIVNIDMDDSAWRQASLPAATKDYGLEPSCARRIFADAERRWTAQAVMD